MFLAINHCLNPVIQPDLDSDYEIIWAKVDIPGLKSVLVGSFYKPKENDPDSLRGLIYQKYLNQVLSGFSEISISLK